MKRTKDAVTASLAETPHDGTAPLDDQAERECVSGGIARRRPIGAEIVPDGKGVHFRVWAPAADRVELSIEGGPGAGRTVAMEREDCGYAVVLVSDAADGTRYRFRLDGSDELLPDPASRFQPDGAHGPSQVVDPSRFPWTDHGWRGRPIEGQILYEMHVGTFTPEGTWEAAAQELPELASLGITAIEMMPVAEFPGAFGWGYDGVDLFAPTRLYGRPDDLRGFVDRAHAHGIAVILDIVYNHFGPDGNYLKLFSPGYFTDRYKNEWGEAVNFDGADAGPVREFFLTNAACWIDEYHLDGLRIDATQQMFDASPDNIVGAVTRAVREASRGRATIVIGENEPQDVKLLRSAAQGGCGLDGLWNDDFHHSAVVALTGHNEAYFTDYRGTAQELVSAMKYGFLYQGQRSKWQGQRRGSPTFGVKPASFVTFVQNHDQIANSGKGERIDRLTTPGRFKAMTALMLLGPGTPMLFQGQEFAASSPFLYFADHHRELAALVKTGRGEFLTQFPSLATPAMTACLTDPGDRATFERCKLDLAERGHGGHAAIYALHRDLLALRRDDPVFRAQRPNGLDGAVLSEEAFVLRFFAEDGGGGEENDRLLLVNLGRDLHLDPAPEPLLAPPSAAGWEILWSSEDPRYGGSGAAPVETQENWRIPAHAAVVLAPARAEAEAARTHGATQ